MSDNPLHIKAIEKIKCLKLEDAQEVTDRVLLYALCRLSKTGMKWDSIVDHAHDFTRKSLVEIYNGETLWTSVTADILDVASHELSQSGSSEAKKKFLRAFRFFIYSQIDKRFASLLEHPPLDLRKNNLVGSRGLRPFPVSLNPVFKSELSFFLEYAKSLVKDNKDLCILLEVMFITDETRPEELATILDWDVNRVRRGLNLLFKRFGGGDDKDKDSDGNNVSPPPVNDGGGGGVGSTYYPENSLPDSMDGDYFGYSVSAGEESILSLILDKYLSEYNAREVFSSVLSINEKSPDISIKVNEEVVESSYTNNNACDKISTGVGFWGISLLDSVMFAFSYITGLLFSSRRLKYSVPKMKSTNSVLIYRLNVLVSALFENIHFALRSIPGCSGFFDYGLKNNLNYIRREISYISTDHKTSHIYFRQIYSLLDESKMHSTENRFKLIKVLEILFGQIDIYLEYLFVQRVMLIRLWGNLVNILDKEVSLTKSTLGFSLISTKMWASIYNLMLAYSFYKSTLLFHHELAKMITGDKRRRRIKRSVTELIKIFSIPTKLIVTNIEDVIHIFGPDVDRERLIQISSYFENISQLCVIEEDMSGYVRHTEFGDWISNYTRGYINDLVHLVDGRDDLDIKIVSETRVGKSSVANSLVEAHDNTTEEFKYPLVDRYLKLLSVKDIFISYTSALGVESDMVSHWANFTGIDLRNEKSSCINLLGSNLIRMNLVRSKLARSKPESIYSVLLEILNYDLSEEQTNVWNIWLNGRFETNERRDKINSLGFVRERNTGSWFRHSTYAELKKLVISYSGSDRFIEIKTPRLFVDNLSESNAWCQERLSLSETISNLSKSFEYAFISHIEFSRSSYTGNVSRIQELLYRSRSVDIWSRSSNYQLRNIANRLNGLGSMRLVSLLSMHKFTTNSSYTGKFKFIPLQRAFYEKPYFDAIRKNKLEKRSDYSRYNNFSANKDCYRKAEGSIVAIRRRFEKLGIDVEPTRKIVLDAFIRLKNRDIEDIERQVKNREVSTLSSDCNQEISNQEKLYFLGKNDNISFGNNIFMYEKECLNVPFEQHKIMLNSQEESGEYRPLVMGSFIDSKCRKIRRGV